MITVSAPAPTAARYLHHLKAIEKAAKTLPDAENFQEDEMVTYDENGREMRFRRLKMKDRYGKGYRWVYDGKVVVGTY